MNLGMLTGSVTAGVMLCGALNGAVIGWDTVDHFESSINYQETKHYVMATIDNEGRIGFIDTVNSMYTAFDSRLLIKRFDRDGHVVGTILRDKAEVWQHTKLQWMNGKLYFGSASNDGLKQYCEWNDDGVDDLYRIGPNEFSDVEDRKVYGFHQMGKGSVRQVVDHGGYKRAYVYRSAETGKDRVIATTSGFHNDGALRLQAMLRENPEGLTDIFRLTADGGLVMGLRTLEGSKIMKFNGEEFETLVTTDDVIDAVDGSVHASMDGYALPYPMATNLRGDLAFIAMTSNPDLEHQIRIDLLVKRDGELVRAGRLLRYKDTWSNKEGLAEFRFQDEMVISESGRVGLIGHVIDSWPSRDFELLVWDGDELIVAADADQIYVGANGREFVYHGSRYKSHLPLYEEGIELFTDAVGNMVFNSSVEADGRVGHGVLLYDTEGVLSLLVKEGDLFDIGGGDMRKIKYIDEHSFWLNSKGILALGLTFTDHSSGVFTMQIPEPSGLILLGLGGLVVLQRKIA